MDRRKKVIEAAEKALVELEKVIKQEIDLAELDPEKAKIAAQAKWAAIEDSFKIIDKIEQVHNTKKEAEEESIKFCKNQKLKGAIVESVNLLESGEFDMIKQKIDDAMKAGGDRNIGHEYNTSIDDRYKESVRNTITTGWEVIDELADGGLGSGELGVMVAPAGIGKSWALANVGANAVKAGKTVLHYTLELSESVTGLRYDSCISAVPLYSF